ncbi:hypothetical protein [Lentzea sp.]|uniref:hypothetical protein n=1 Tax=Lentzea sp. TaxID=56099 RepID=UPI002ED281CB
MAEFVRLTWPIAAVLAFSLSAVVVRRWWQKRKHRAADEHQAVGLTPLARTLGGEVVRGEGSAAWSADLRGPMANDLDGIVDKMLQRSVPRFDLAVDFMRGTWHVRVSQASMRQQDSNGVGRLIEHRFEVATTLLAPMRLTRRRHADFRGRPVAPGRFSGWTAEKPLTAVREQTEWLPLRLPPAADHEFAVFAADLSGAARAFNPEAAQWLVDRVGDLPPLVAWIFSLTFESGIVHTTVRGPIDEESLLSVVDVITGLLDLIPDVRPRHPAAAV